MAVTADIWRTWRGPRAVMRGFLAQGPREDRALAFLFLGCLLLFVAQLPRLVRVAEGLEAAPGQEAAALSQLAAYAFFGSVLVLPLMFYLLAAFSHLVARALGGQGSWFGARLALFWALLASAPLALLYGLVRGFIGPGPQAALVGVGWCVAFGVIWLLSLIEAERP
ncbi:hypothetical protein OG2516_03665 [Oceanicola granulosus HTCC2516]|uniref:Yip1 domain-containing protein n=1 Tax=Oceanicola granulosus (strain ATCC BAA-861 / DSM 15982 / KCTC 12143 / HTCC2516) TaxID=314256 RepID=Q2CG78_OCEGH|nr:YIP1 family protein [Oceanicola granulosus]EAR51651.1 hypothetical protein OG2516_03665 [Oceanicola granulosus HTCC2516]